MGQAEPRSCACTIATLVKRMSSILLLHKYGGKGGWPRKVEESPKKDG